MSTQPLVFVTGANQGIGLAVTNSLAISHSYHVLLGVRNLQAGEAEAKQIRDAGHNATVIDLDLTSEKSVSDAISTIEKQFGYLDALINNAGILIDRRLDLSKWDLYSQTFTTNVVGTGVLTEGLLPLLKKAKIGPPRIIFVSSIMGSLGVSLDKTTPWYPTDYKVYDASKAACNLLAINFARELDSVGGKVNCVCPGLVKSNLTGFIEYGESPEAGATRIVELATAGKEAPTATFSNKHSEIAW